MSDESRDSSREPEAKEGKSEEIFEVEKILAHKVTDNKLLLKVRWLGYGPDEDTFEPEDDLKECASEVVDEYYRKMKVNDKTELIERLQKQIKRNKTLTAKKRERTPSPDVDDDDGSESDGSYSSGAKRNKKPSKNSTPSSSLKAPKVPTKAALKSYDGSSASHGHVPPNKAKQAASRIRVSMFGDSSDEEDASPIRTTVDELQSKVKPKETKDIFQSPVQKSTETLKQKTEIGSNVISNRSSSPQPCSSSSAGSSSYKATTGNLETNGRHRSHVVPPKKEEPLWSVTGIVRHRNESNVVDKLILMTNSSTGDRKVLNPDEAFDLDSWALTKYLLDRCEF